MRVCHNIEYLWVEESLRGEGAPSEDELVNIITVKGEGDRRSIGQAQDVWYLRYGCVVSFFAMA